METLPCPVGASRLPGDQPICFRTPIGSQTIHQRSKKNKLKKIHHSLWSLTHSLTHALTGWIDGLMDWWILYDHQNSFATFHHSKKRSRNPKWCPPHLWCPVWHRGDVRQRRSDRVLDVWWSFSRWHHPKKGKRCFISLWYKGLFLLRQMGSMCMYVCIYLSICLSVYLSIYIVCKYIYIYTYLLIFTIYIYIYPLKVMKPHRRDLKHHQRLWVWHNEASCPLGSSGQSFAAKKNPCVIHVFYPTDGSPRPKSFQLVGLFTTDAWEIVAPWPCFLLVWLLHQKGIGCYSASPDAIWFGHHGYSQSCEGCDHKQRCSTGSPRTSHCLSRFQCLDYWLAYLAPGRWLSSAGTAGMLPWMAVLVSTSRALVGQSGLHVRCTWLAAILSIL